MAQMDTETEPGSTAEQAKEKAQHAGDQAKDKLREQIDERSTEAGERLGSAARDVRDVADELGKQGKDQPAKLAGQVAERVERVSDYLTESEADRILRDVEDFGRSKPWAVALGGLVIGFAASRFLKASSSQRYHQLQREPVYTPRQALSPAITSDETPVTPMATSPSPGPTTGVSP
jgi:hypothetical protein